MHIWEIVAVLVLAAVGAVVWMTAWHPLALLVRSSRRSLARAGLKRRWVPSPAGRQLAFTGGSGPLLVLLHGAGDQAGTWARVAPALLQRHTLIIPDLAGHGSSAPASGPIGGATILAGLEAVLDHLAGPAPATLVGNSMGAWMAMVLAQRHPGRFRMVVAVDGGPLKHAGAVTLRPADREQARRTMAALRDDGAPGIPDLVLDDLVRQARTGPLARLEAAGAALEATLLDEDQLRRLDLPVRLIWGASDRLLPLDYARRVAAALPDASLTLIDRCGHLPQQEAPERFLATLLGVLDPGTPPQEFK